MITFDELRTKYPHLSYAVYAYDPGGDVTLECLTKEGQTFKFSGPTLAEAITAGFPEEADPAPQPEPPVSDAAPDASVFD